MKLLSHRLIAVLVFGLGFLVGLQTQASAGTRLALVIGNAKYQGAPELGNPANDAADVAKALHSIGFEVIEKEDATRDEMATAIRDFSAQLSNADIALFFYAGHALQINGENYLLPVNANANSPADVRFSTINMSDIQEEINSNGNRANIIILDACRNDPFLEKLAQHSRAVPTRGIGRIDAASEGSLIVYSTQPNNVALDGTGRNSPFTAALLKFVTVPGVEIRQMISKVRADVLQATDHHQTPWDNSSLVGDVFLAGGNAPPSLLPLAKTTPLSMEVTGAARPVNEAPVLAQTKSSSETSLSDTEKECDQLTAPRGQVDPKTTVSIKEIDWQHAIEVCQAALKAKPSEPHFESALGVAFASTKNYVEAARHYKIAADAGVARAQTLLGYAFFRGHGVVKNDQRAFELWSKAADAGSPTAMQDLGMAYADGVYVKKDPVKSLDWNERAIEAGDIEALANVGTAYLNGFGVERDFVMAAQYFQQGADLGNGPCLKSLANMYEAGFMSEPDPGTAGALRLRAEQLDPGKQDPSPISVFRGILAASRVHKQVGQVHKVVHRRRYVVYRPYRFYGCFYLWC